ncbi:MAG: ABC transporter permease [Proteobacteria bacterium]|jgi:spermidine/putrescine transport system permease protein|nr:ABC transporter permease [Pseudomonadota bacterium]MDA0844752.1 ABC transporter permease [Pseudomonadota bacterium]
MKSQHLLKALLGIYIFIFFAYLFGPLIIMSITAFNSAEFPAVTPWECFSWRWFTEGKVTYDGQRLAGLLADTKLHEGILTSLRIALGVVILSVPIGMAAAIVLTQVNSKIRTLFYSMAIMPVLFPGVVIGISTVVLWDRIASMTGGGVMADIGRNGVFLTILAQTCFISTYCFLIFVARLQRFDKTQEEAALDLGASQTQVFFKILMPYLMPAIASSAVIAFLYSFENYNTTVFSILSDQTLTTVIASKVRLGISPAISALALVIIAITLTAAISYEVLKRREERRLAKIKQMQLHQAMPSDRLMKNQKTGIKLPKSMFLILLLAFGVIAGGNYLVKNNLYGTECILAADEAKKSNFADQLKLLQQNAGDGGATTAPSGPATGSQGFNNIFGDPNLFKNFGGFDSKTEK